MQDFSSSFVRMIDAHTHLTVDEFREKRLTVLDDFLAVGGTALVTVGMDDLANQRGIQVAQEVEDSDHPVLVKTTVGYHPYEIVSGAVTIKNLMQKIQELTLLLEENEHYIVAIGECGIDLHYDDAEDTLDVQQQALALQCQLALQYGLPVVIHSRDAFEETLIVLEDFVGVDFYFHCRGYGPEEVASLLEKHPGCRIGFCGNVTYKKAVALRDSLSVVPAESLLLETDAPYLTPQVVRGEKNKPAFVSHIYDFVADHLEQDREQLVEQVSANFYSLYHL